MTAITRRLIVALLLALLPLMAACTPEPGELLVVDDGRQRSLEAVVPELLDKDVIFIGERHDRYDHHLNQLAVIEALHRRGAKLAIGLEFFQRPFQSWLDDYIAGQLEEGELLGGTEYFQRWGFDYRLYRPILRFAREQGIPLIALNAPREASRKVSQGGLEALGAGERPFVAREIDQSDQAYRARLRALYDRHPQTFGDFERFWQVQLLWDETMAERAADYLGAHPDTTLVVLAGSGHLAHRSGIPNRLERRLAVDSALLLPEEGEGSRGADYLLVSQQVFLPPAGRLGVMLEDMVVQEVLPDSGAARAGVRPDDRILAVDGRSVNDFTELRLALQDRRPEETVSLRVERAGSHLPLEVTLH
ncbi:MAG: ChaN family lipoprotein [Candidatus Competibacteraceae bacterium]|nr:ChaN family lipoprotein [Candidatus Competibacteraceae bacterium]